MLLLGTKLSNAQFGAEDARPVALGKQESLPCLLLSSPSMQDIHKYESSASAAYKYP